MARYRSGHLGRHLDTPVLQRFSLALQVWLGSDACTSTWPSTGHSFLLSLWSCSSSSMVSSFSPPLFILIRSISTSPALVQCSPLHGHFVASSSVSISSWLLLLHCNVPSSKRSKVGFSSPQVVGTEARPSADTSTLHPFALAFSSLLFPFLPIRHPAPYFDMHFDNHADEIFVALVFVAWRGFAPCMSPLSLLTSLLNL